MPKTEGALDKAAVPSIIHAMNDFYSHPEIYLPRWLSDDLRLAIRDHPVVILTGARQVGKSTLLRNAEPFASWRFRTMDDYDTLRQAEEDPQGLWAGTEQVVLDEVQKAVVNPKNWTGMKRMFA